MVLSCMIEENFIQFAEKIYYFVYICSYYTNLCQSVLLDGVLFFQIFQQTENQHFK
jgi:hypothetical protein